MKREADFGMAECTMHGQIFFYSTIITKIIYVITIDTRVAKGIHKFCLKHAAVTIKSIALLETCLCKVNLITF